ncbi:MAG: lysophospholipid acyltransferase family protein [Alphaproteobacteria bacterium]|nr:lysophospholipid acyltransferase family protein [Alphaproteobacteria bacterium]
MMLISNALRHPVRERFARAYHAACCRIFDIHVEQRGEMRQERPTLFAANHCSYLDIIVLGGIVKGSFVAKKEIEAWPVFGFMAGLQRSIFIDRRPRYAAGQRDTLSERLLDHENVILFAEGTSSDGMRTKPFKSALFSVAELEVDGRPLVIQPVSITYTRLDGIPLGRHLRPLIAWYGDMELLPHGWTFLGLGRLTVVVEFHQPVTLDAFGSRKALAEHCSSVVAQGVAAALAGRTRSDGLRPEGGPAPLLESPVVSA